MPQVNFEYKSVKTHLHYQNSSIVPHRLILCADEKVAQCIVGIPIRCNQVRILRYRDLNIFHLFLLGYSEVVMNHLGISR